MARNCVFREHNLVVFGEGSVWHVMRAPSYGWTYTAMFVLVLATLMMSFHAVWSLLEARGVALSLALAVGGGVGVALGLRLHRYQQTRAVRVTRDAIELFLIDWDAREVRLPDGFVGSLDACRLVKVSQVYSSAPALVLAVDGYRVPLLEGHPFGVSIEGLVSLLSDRGLPVERKWLPG